MPAYCVVFFPALGLVVFLPCTKSFWTETRVVSVRRLNTTGSKPLEFDLHLGRLQKGVYSMSGTILVTDSIEGYDSEVEIDYSKHNNNDFKSFPLRILRGAACRCLNNEYRRFVMKDLHKVSDLPYTDDPKADICEMLIPGTRYTVRHFIPAKRQPFQFLLPGNYRLTSMYSKNRVVTGGQQIVIEFI